MNTQVDKICLSPRPTLKVFFRAKGTIDARLQAFRLFGLEAGKKSSHGMSGFVYLALIVPLNEFPGFAHWRQRLLESCFVHGRIV